MIQELSTDKHRLTQMRKLPEGWEWKKLGEIITLEYGKPLQDEKRRKDGKYIVYGANGEKDRTNDFYYDKKSIIVGRKGSAGEVTITKDKFWPLDVTYFLKFDEQKYDLYFLYHTLVSLELQKLAKGVKPGINRNEVYSIKVRIPPLSDQKRIVAILDEAFTAIDKAKDNAEKNLANAKELFESYLNGIFANPGDDWEEKKLGEISLKIGSGATPLGGQKAYKSQGISLIRSLNIHDDDFKYADLAFIDETQASKLSNVIIESKDVLLNITGASIARCNIVPDNVLPARVNQHVSIIRLKKDILLPEFLYYMLISKFHKNKLLYSGEKNGATRQALTKVLIENYEVSYPHMIIQKEIITKIEAIKHEIILLEKKHQKEIAFLNELKKSILKKAFEGEL